MKSIFTKLTDHLARITQLEYRVTSLENKLNYTEQRIRDLERRANSHYPYGTDSYFYRSGNTYNICKYCGVKTIADNKGCCSNCGAYLPSPAEQG